LVQVEFDEQEVAQTSLMRFVSEAAVLHDRGADAAVARMDHNKARPTVISPIGMGRANSGL
jgi:hypothetical protein